MSKCKYCGIESRLRGGVCENCCRKKPLLPRFVKARDDLREKLGLERLGDK